MKLNKILLSLVAIAFAVSSTAKGNEQFAGVGHCSVYTFGDKDYRSKLIVREVNWSEDGWPVVEL